MTKSARSILCFASAFSIIPAIVLPAAGIFIFLSICLICTFMEMGITPYPSFLDIWGKETLK